MINYSGMSYTKLYRNSLLVFLLLGTLMFFIPVGIFIYAGSILFFATLLNSKKHTLVRRIILSWMVHFTAVIIIYIIIHLLSLNLDFRGSLMILVLALHTWGFKNKKVPTLGKIVDNNDIASLVLAILTFLILLLPVLNNSKETFLLFLSSGEDNASHIALLNYNFRNQNYSYFVDTEQTGLIESLVIYQQGLHLNEAFVTKLVLPEYKGYMALLYSFYLQGIFYYSLLVFMLSYICLSVSNVARKNYFHFYSFLPLLLSFASFGILLYLLGWGFYTQTVSYLLLLILSYLILKKEKAFDSELFLLSCAAICAISNVWYFLIPVAMATAIIYLADVNRLIKKPKIFLSVFLLASASAVPIIISSLLSTKSNPINEPGGVYIMSNISIIASFLLLIGIFIFRRKFTHNIRISLIYPACVAASFSAAIWLYQIITIGRNEYYFYKSIYTVFIYLVIFIIFFGLQLTSKYLPRSYMICVSIFALGVLLIFVIKPVYPRVYLNNWFNHSLELSDISVLQTSLNKQHVDDILFIGDCKVPSDYISNRWAGALFLSENRLREAFKAQRINGRDITDENSKLVDYIRSSDDEISVRVSPECASSEAQIFLKGLNNTVLYN